MFASQIPTVLTDRRQWVCWRSKQRNGHVTKVPIDPTTGEFASTAEPSSWASFERAQAYAADRASIAGIGFVFTAKDPFVGVDLDGCRTPATGVLDDWAREIVETLQSYTEISPSGTGLHILVRGSIPGDKCRQGSVEMYETGRFFTVTGDTLAGSPTAIRKRTEPIESVYREYVARTESTAEEDESGKAVTDRSDITGDRIELSDTEILSRARQAKNGDRFTRLWRGDQSLWGPGGPYPSQSEADLALVAMLAFWTGRDHDRIDRLFRRSGLYRAKWDKVHRGDGATYGEMTIETALSSVTTTYDPEYHSGNNAEAHSL